MDYSIQNSETGEVDYFQTDLYAQDIVKCPPNYDEETGEPTSNNDEYKVRYVKRRHFQIPKVYWKQTPCDEMEAKWAHENDEQSSQQDPKTKYNRHDYLKMECVRNDIVLAYKKSNMILFLVPTLFFFNVYVLLLMLLLESFFHFWSHIKNGLKTHKTVYFRSPLHVLTSQFCARCRSESDSDFKTFQMLNKQMRQAYENGTLRDVSKAFT